MCELIETPITKSILRPNGCVIHYKRDDLLPYSFGGNKVRIAYEFLKDLKGNGCDTIVGYGSAKSNLSRVVANLSTQLSGGGISLHHMMTVRAEKKLSPSTAHLFPSVV